MVLKLLFKMNFVRIYIKIVIIDLGHALLEGRVWHIVQMIIFMDIYIVIKLIIKEI